MKSHHETHHDHHVTPSCRHRNQPMLGILFVTKKTISAYGLIKSILWKNWPMKCLIFRFCPVTTIRLWFVSS